MKKFAAFILILLLFLPSVVYAQDLSGVEAGFKWFFTFLFGFPEEWDTGQYIWNGIFPWFGVWIIIFGFMTAIHPFGTDRNKVYGFLSFIIAFSLLPLGWFAILVQWLFAIMGAWTVIAFFIIFMLGVLLITYKNVYRHYRGIIREKKVFGSLESQLDKIDRQINHEYSRLKGKKAANLTEDDKKKILKNIAELRAQRNKVVETMGDVSRA